MRRGTLVLAVLALFIAGLAALTVITIAKEGLSVAGAFGIVIVVFLAIGIIGAAATPPD